MRTLNLFLKKLKQKNSLGGSHPSDDPTQGSIFFEQAVSSPING